MLGVGKEGLGPAPEWLSRSSGSWDLVEDLLPDPRGRPNYENIWRKALDQLAEQLYVASFFLRRSPSLAREDVNEENRVEDNPDRSNKNN